MKLMCEHLRMIGSRHDRQYCNLTGKELAPWQKCDTNCKDYSGSDNTLPKIEDERTMGKRFDWDQPAKNYFADAAGETLREYLKQNVKDSSGSVAAYAANLGVTPSALQQAISRELRPRTVIRTPLGINWEAPAVDVVGNKHLVNPCRVSLINWCSDCLDEECYTREELAKLIGCKPEDLQAALNKYLGDVGDEEEPETDRSNDVTCHDPEEERKARETECVKQGNNIPADYTPEPGFEIDPPAPSIQQLETNEQWHNTMTSAFAETAPDALSAFLRVTGQEDLFRGFVLGYEARGEEAA